MRLARTPGAPTKYRPGLWVRGISEEALELLAVWMDACEKAAEAARDETYSIMVHGRPLLSRILRARLPELSAREWQQTHARLLYIMGRSQWLARHPPGGTA